MKNTGKWFAVISDVHGNYEALEKAIKIIKKRKPDEIIFLGDAIGYGADPVKCFHTLQKNCSVMLMGNHEAMILASEQKMSSLCKESFEWTKKHIDIAIRSDIEKLPLAYRNEAFSFFHAAPDNTLMKWRYLNDTYSVIEAFQGHKEPCFFGHTHRPRVVIVGDDVTDDAIMYTKEYCVDISKNCCYINPGSIGQQRDQKTELSFALCRLDGHMLHIRIERHSYHSLKTYIKVRYKGCGLNNANYLIREKWKRKLYESIGNRLERFYRSTGL